MCGCFRRPLTFEYPPQCMYCIQRTVLSGDRRNSQTRDVSLKRERISPEHTHATVLPALRPTISAFFTPADPSEPCPACVRIMRCVAEGAFGSW